MRYSQARRQAVTEYLVVVALVLVAAIAAYAYLGSIVKAQMSATAQELAGTESETKPSATQSCPVDAKSIIPIGMAMFTAAIGGIAWATKQAIAVSYRRVQWQIIEALRDKEKYGRSELCQKLERRVTNSIFLDALADLVLLDRVKIEHSKYFLPEQKERNY